jgi:hypothetical protein
MCLKNHLAYSQLSVIKAKVSEFKLRKVLKI